MRREIKKMSVLEAVDIKYHQSFPFPRTEDIRGHFTCKDSHSKKMKCMGKNILKSFCVKYLLP